MRGDGTTQLLSVDVHLCTMMDLRIPLNSDYLNT